MLKQRIEGRAIRTYSVEGGELLTYDEWDVWTKEKMDIFDKLYDKWEKSGFARKLTPSVDRINSKGSYTADNIQWLTLSSNSSKGNKER